jgi:hypothetical protein
MSSSCQGVVTAMTRTTTSHASAPSSQHEIFTRDNFGVGLDRVFQIYDDAVGGRRKPLGEAFGPIAWYEQEASFSGHSRFLLPPRRAGCDMSD